MNLKFTKTLINSVIASTMHGSVPSMVRKLKNIWANFLVLSNLNCTNFDECDATCGKNFSKAIAHLFKSPFSLQNFGHKRSKLRKTFGQILDRNITLGNFTAVKILKGKMMHSMRIIVHVILRQLYSPSPPSSVSRHPG